MTCKSALFAAIILICTITACKKDPSSTTHPHSDPATVTDVYAAGSIDVGGNSVAAYWKNGTATMLGSGKSGLANGIAISGSDVYVVGYRTAANNYPVATYWKNGIHTDLADSTTGSAANAIVISGSDVYISGYVQDPNNNPIAAYWKNGVINLLANNTIQSAAFPIAVKNNDVYVAGNVVSPTRFDATYWKNSTQVTVSSGKPEYSSQLYGIAFSGDDTYFIGQVYGSFVTGQTLKYVAAVWKNGTPSLLTDGTTYSIAQGISIQGTDIYIAGDKASGTNVAIAGYWKNGNFNALGDGSHNSDAAAIATSGTDVYVAGTNTSGFATYWKNGSAVQLANSSSGAYAIAIVSK